MKTLILLSWVVIFLAACVDKNQKSIENGTFLKGNISHFVETIERQLDGFSRTMMEVHYRYGELYWAGQDGNWKYADYQLEHIYEAIDKGSERRPEHKNNAFEFLGAPHNLMQQAIDSGNIEQFNRNFVLYNASCKSCHIKEEVDFIQTIIPEERKGYTRFLN